jgi:hypothetical protein
MKPKYIYCYVCKKKITTDTYWATPNGKRRHVYCREATSGTAAAARRHVKLDQLTRTHTAFSSWAELTDTTATDYLPTLTTDESQPLADAYDTEMSRRGDPRRARRGGKA